jgi:hypothetical protein
MLEHDTKRWESRMKTMQMGKELGLSIEDVRILVVWEMLLSYSLVHGEGRTVSGSEGISPCRLRTMSTSCMASNTG